MVRGDWGGTTIARDTGSYRGTLRRLIARDTGSYSASITLVGARITGDFARGARSYEVDSQAARFCSALSERLLSISR
jgi:hypothetical protein